MHYFCQVDPSIIVFWLVNIERPEDLGHLVVMRLRSDFEPYTFTNTRDTRELEAYCIIKPYIKWGHRLKPYVYHLGTRSIRILTPPSPYSPSLFQTETISNPLSCHS